MNREFNPTSTVARTLLAVGSLIVSTLLLGAVVGLADHYGENAQLASAGRPIFG